MIFDSFSTTIVFISIILFTVSNAFLRKNQLLEKQLQTKELEAIRLKEVIVDLEVEINEYHLQKRKYEDIFNSIQLPFFSMNVNTGELIISKGLQNIIGYTQKDFNQDPIIWHEIVYDEDKEILDEIIRELKNGKPVECKLRIIKSSRELKWVNIHAIPLVNLDGEFLVNGHIIDISDYKKLEEKLNVLAYQDELTDLPNRTLLQKQLKKSISRSNRNGTSLLVMFIDLDGFKKINDTLGHAAGDRLLQEVSHRLTDSVREEDLVARLGGDEFVIVLEDTSKQAGAEIAKRILDNVNAIYMINDNKVNVSPSIGISCFPDDGQDIETLCHHADVAMYVVKERGKSNYLFYEPGFEEVNTKKTILDKIISTFRK
ncbi:sensor domain-containing diguanylate cyclase [Metabacillus litoralis]|uniref:sensor domain-containing diguanylate cyclase n=1 Tax=Metabacillus litoralis TaxID=152268 RepID=UPI001E5D58F8|nr:sensor domain-containing diguanylate cyclase [Metabacillus litoralis]UHA60850.1 sensor domain-containing diguanylate cyclase [Metabacillus litoralis]